MFCDPDTFEPVLTFLSLEDLPSQDADGIKNTINAAFNDISMPEFLVISESSMLVFLASDGASVNSGVWRKVRTSCQVSCSRCSMACLVFVP